MRAETEVAIRAVSTAIQRADAREGADNVDSKGGIDIVTATDVICEDAIRAELTDAFADYPIVGEERGGEAAEDRPYWLVDPICGTRPYASNIPMYCTNIALVEDGRVTVAAVAIGGSGEVMFAEKGNGAWLRTKEGDRPITPSEESNTLWIGTHTEQGANVVRNAMLLKRWYIMQAPTSLGYPYVAAGRISGLIHMSPKLSSVHTAAGCFLAEEAGAVVTGVETGKPWKIGNAMYLLAATPILHKELMELVNGSA